MYPHADLTQLTSRKEALRRLIAAQREGLVQEIATVLRPVRWLDRANALRQRIAPLWWAASLPIGWWFSRPRVDASVAGWRRCLAAVPWVLRAFRLVSQRPGGA